MPVNRRKFIKTAAAGIAGTSLLSPGLAFASSARTSAADQLNVALVGVRNMGWANLRDFLKQPGVVCRALVDIDRRELERRSKDVTDSGQKKPDLYKDYRKMLEDKDIDVVIIGTPDHWHCMPMVDAMEAGKHVYVEKPLANSLAEINVMLDAAKKYGKLVQVGQQQRSGSHWKAAIDLVQSGKLGKIRQVKHWGNFNYGAGNEPVPDSEVPEGVDYNMWLGPAPRKPFNKNRFHGSWRMFRDYGGGLMTDWGVHLLDMGIWAMNIKTPPKSVVANGGTYVYKDHALEWPDTLHVLYEMDDFMMTWEHNGGIQVGPWNRLYGVAFIGTNGTLVADRDNWEVFPEWGGEDFRMEEIPMMESDKMSHINHVKNFVDAVRLGEELNADIEVGHRAAMFAHLGNIAYITGDKLQYDQDKRQFLNSSAANNLIKPDYRDPWTFPKV